MLETLNDWTRFIDNGDGVDVIYFDFSKAFDKVSHMRLGKTFSNVRAASSGVPQGCVLSPILYNIYTYELPRLVENAAVHCKVFADDMKIYRSVSDASDSNIIQNAIDVVSAWSKRGEKNKLVVPRSKTRVRTKFFAIRAATQFSKLMKSSTLPKNIAQFKNLLHHHFK
ncbi:hypothetical protein COOONC_16531 [Cooperia oncophora]